jgi:hypothetical protein
MTAVIAVDCHHGLMVDASNHSISLGLWNILIGGALQAAPKSDMVSRE